MTTKDFNLAYREAVSLMLRRLRVQALSEFPRVTDKMLASSLGIQPNTFSRLYRRCFNASPVVLLRLYYMLGARSFDNCLFQAGLHKSLSLLRSVSSVKLEHGELIPCFVDAQPGEVVSDSEGCPADCHGDCEFCVKG